jgi:hydrogenase nickel incorporation protein HypA/HybF
MHELQVTKRILDIALAHTRGHQVRRIAVIHLRIGALSDLEDEWLQRYFDHLSHGTLAEGARLAIERMPIAVRCSDCAKPFEVEKSALEAAACPGCGGSRCELVSGKEYVVANMEVI